MKPLASSLRQGQGGALSKIPLRSLVRGVTEDLVDMRSLYPTSDYEETLQALRTVRISGNSYSWNG